LFTVLISLIYAHFKSWHKKQVSRQLYVLAAQPSRTQNSVPVG